ncbi:hypothetical protein GYA93_21365 [Gordonia desulfuricans]|uniref:Uncharacterized protein n=1 Tax=Gordonia desulfuricans TaxID=89051 RepID=A0A7K3LV19_9ACTN|nr:MULTISPECIES: hypothetical protein [Gordonia]EMP13810.1 hypothetical protein ISGA_1355 [Gordonia sp. NB41Y]NDK92094.1 hypothetical protein [Gordonia desulfuricans]WLP90563.1 hypothetical protein Q9K23_24235 [Gordonia sp. NB41Y]
MTTPPRPNPQMMPGSRPTGPGVHQIDPELATTVTARVRELLDQVDQIRSEQTESGSGESFDLVALARQTNLLEEAHDVLTSTLSELDRR